jgi:protein TonB
LTKRPELVGKVKPIYPDGARRAKIEGHVIVRALVLPSGEVLVTGVLSWNNPMFIDSAAEAVAQWTYKPGTIEGKPAAVDYVIRVDYWMENDPATKATRTP